MSKEFEEIVLKKLENLENEVKNTQQGFKNLSKDMGQRIGGLEIEVKNTQQGLKSLSKDMEQRIGGLEIEVKNTQQGLKNLSKDMEQRIGGLEIGVKETEDVVKYLNQNFTKFDYEINKKIDTLFDAFTTNKDKISVHETEIASLNAKVFNQDIRISNLEDKVLAAV